MASFDAPLYTKQVGDRSASPSAAYPLAKVSAGKLRYAVVQYVLDGAETTGDTINLCKLKEGALPIAPLCKVLSQAAFDADDVNIGTTANPNSLADAMDLTNAETALDFTGGDDRFVPVAIAEGGEVIVMTLVSVVTTTAGQLALVLIAFLDE